MNSKANSKPRVTKSGQVKQYLYDKGRIDSWTAINLFGATRLSAIIFVLRKKGFEIITENLTMKDRNGNICKFANYKLILQQNKI
jgi:hypothetical protein